MRLSGGSNAVLNLPEAHDFDQGFVQLTAQRLAHRRRNARWLTTIGLALFVAGFAGFGVLGDRSDQLAATGTHATGTVVEAALYSSNGGRLGRNAFSEHVDVRFTTRAGRVVTARCWIGEDDQLPVGRRVEIVYDPSDPQRAQLASDPDLGPVGFPLLLGIALGFGLAIAGTFRARTMTKARKQLRRPPARCVVSIETTPAGRRRGFMATLESPEGRVAQMRASVIAGSGIIQGRPTDGVVFGAVRRRRSVVVMQAGGAVVTGRVTYIR